MDANNQKEGSEVDLIVRDDHTLMVVPKRKKPTLEELLAQCKPENPQAGHEQAGRRAAIV